MYPFDCISDFIFVETEIKKADIILIPGGSHPQMAEKAAELYLKEYAPYILPSGGANPKLTDFGSEWEFLKKTVISLGVPEDRILKEDKAQHTFDNARLSYKMIQSFDNAMKSAIIVCKAYHSRRALLTYQTVFPPDFTFYICPVADKYGVARDSWYLDEGGIRKVMSEVRKIGVYFEQWIPSWVR